MAIVEEEKKKKLPPDIGELEVRHSSLKKVGIGDSRFSALRWLTVRALLGAMAFAIGWNEVVLPSGIPPYLSNYAGLVIGFGLFAWDLWAAWGEDLGRPSSTFIAIAFLFLFSSGIETVRFHWARQSRLELHRSGETKIAAVTGLDSNGEEYFVRVGVQGTERFLEKSFKVRSRDFAEKLKTGQNIRVVFPKNQIQDFILADFDLAGDTPIELVQTTFFSILFFILWVNWLRRLLLRN